MTQTDTTARQAAKRFPDRGAGCCSRWRAAATFACALVATNAQALVTADLSVRNLTMEVSDLNPSDGIAPAFWIGGAAPPDRPWSMFTMAAASLSLNGQPALIDQSRTTLFLDPMSADVSSHGASSRVSLNPQHEFDLHSHVLDQGAAHSVVATGAEEGGYPWRMQTIGFGAYTQVTVSFDLDVWAKDTGAVGPWMSSAGVFASLSGNVGSFASQVDELILSTELDTYADAFQLSRRLSITLANLDEVATIGALRMQFDTNAHWVDTTPPVPEPQTYVLLAAGLAGLVWRCRSGRCRVG